MRIEREYQYLYTDGEAFHFMNNDDYNQVEIQKDLIPPTFEGGYELQGHLPRG